MGKKVLLQISLSEDRKEVTINQFVETKEEMSALAESLIDLYINLSENEDFMTLVSMASKEEMMNELIKQTIKDNFNENEHINS